MDIKQLNELISGKPFFYSQMHDYTLKEDHIESLGLFEEEMYYLRTFVPVEWAFVETRRNPENGFLRINIIKVS